MVYTQIGPGTTSGSGDVTVNYGAGTPAGAAMVAFAMVRSATATLTSFGDNSGTNTWTSLGAAVGQAEYNCQIFGWYIADADACTAFTVDFSEAVAANLTIILLPDGATSSPLDGYDTNIENADPLTAVTVDPTEAESTVIGVMGRITNRTFAQVNSDYTALTGASSGSLWSHYAIRENAGTDPTGPQWDLTAGGSATTCALMTVGIKMAGDSPDPLGIDAGANQAITLGNNATLTAVVSGGSGGSTGSWSQISGPSATIATPTSLSTAVSFPGGVGTYVFRRSQNEGIESVTDDVTVTVSAAPSFVTFATVNVDTDWTATGGTTLAVLSDTSDATSITSAESPTGQTLDMTSNPVTLNSGQSLIHRLRARRVDASTASVTGYLYDDEDNLLSTSSAVSVTGTVADVNVVFPAADLVGLTTPATVRVVTEWTAAE